MSKKYLFGILSLLALITTGTQSAYAAPIRIPISNEGGVGVWDLGTLTMDDTDDEAVVGSQDKQWNYQILLDGTENLDEIRVAANAYVGLAGDGFSYDSWEVLKFDAFPPSDITYNWTLNTTVNISSVPLEQAGSNPEYLTSDSVYGVILHHSNAMGSSYNVIKEVTGTVNIDDYRAKSTWVPNYENQPAAYGVEVGAFYDVKKLSTNVNASNSSSAVGYLFDAGARVGVDENNKAIAGQGMTGTITMTNVYQASGMVVEGTHDFNDAEAPQFGYISSDIIIRTDETQAGYRPVGAAVGIYVDGVADGKENEVKGQLNGIFNGSIDIDVDYDKTVASSYGTPVVAGIQVEQSNDLIDYDALITFGDGANISAMYTMEGETTAQFGDSVNLIGAHDNAFRLTTEHDTDVVKLEGNLRSYTRVGEGATATRVANDLTFEQGTFEVTADIIEAASITLGRIDPTTRQMTDGHLVLKQSTDAKSVEKLDFYVNSPEKGDFSNIVIESGTLTLHPPDDFNIHLGDSVLKNEEFEIILIDGDVDGLAEGSIINIKNSLGHTLWTIDMIDGFYTYTSEELTAGLFEVEYSERGVILRATVKDLELPEPSTATLSLLALAGLLARRRRKNTDA